MHCGWTAVCVSASAETTLHITFAGDCTLGSEETLRNQASSFVSTITREGYDWPFANMQELFQNDDLTVVNLEGVLSDSNKQENKKKTFRFRGPTDYVNILTRSGIEAVNLANNHTQDFGKQGFTSTQQTLDAAASATSAVGPITSGKRTASRSPFSAWAPRASTATRNGRRRKSPV